MRPIDADELIPLIKMGEMNTYSELGEGRNGGIAFAIERINQMPTIEERRKGKWIISPYPDRDDVLNYECNNCGMSFSYNKHTEARPNYCMHCGLKMEGKA